MGKEGAGMSTSINSNYSQFYRGSEPIRKHGSGAGGKDTLVRYEFNTTDANGNKVMDKMSKEEALNTMKEISSQYGDNVLVSFSGDGLAALELHKGMWTPEEQSREIPEWMITHHEGPTALTEEQLTSVKEKYGTDSEAQMRVMDPEAYNEYQKVKAEGLAAGTKEGIVAGARYMINWLTTKAKGDPAWIERANEGIKKETTAESKLSTDAQKYLDTLRKKYGDYDFFVSGSVEDRKKMLQQGDKDFSVVIDIEELERMAHDGEYATEKIKQMESAIDMAKKVSEEFGFTEDGGENGTLTNLSITLKKDGSMSIFAELEKSSARQRERIEAAKEKRAEEKKAADKKAEEQKTEEERAADEDEDDVKRVTIAASSEEDLMRQFRELDWTKV